MENQVKNTITNKDLEKYLDAVDITVECGTTGFDHKEDGTLLYAYISNDTLELEDISIQVFGENIIPTDNQTELIKQTLITAFQNESEEIEEVCTEAFDQNDYQHFTDLIYH